ncbi:Acylphosphatase [Chlamydiales bacterium SCGC AG-110-M15]|nr:Acylphosphatase [Chlamydiales bacterium SCGC AG-110-M15]
MKGSLELHAIVHGRVQGVCFRATVTQHANSLGVLGTVKNLPDGTVEIYAQGLQKQLNDLLDLLVRDPGYGSVSSINKSFSEATSLFTDFNVVY